MTTLADEHRKASTVVLHGTHPLDGHAVTWHITALPVDSRGHANYLVERADGHVVDTRQWSTAAKDVSVLSTAGVQELVRRSGARRAAGT